MSLIRPFAGLRPAPGRAAEIAAPPYDVLSTAEARSRSTGRPWSFLHISKPEIDLPEGTDPYTPAVYAKAAENLGNLLAQGLLVRDSSPCYYAYRLIMGEHVQIGLVAAASVADYDANRIRKHEFTRPDKEDDRVRQIEAINAQTGPVLLAYPACREVDEILAETTQNTPDADITADDGIRHSIWAIGNSDIQTHLTSLFEAMPALYIADGHHRSAAASRVAAARRVAPGYATSCEHFLAVIFPHHQMKIMDYNRVITDLNGLDEQTFLDRIGEGFSVVSEATQVRPAHAGQFGLYLKKRWFRLTIRAELIPTQDPVGRLDVSLLQNFLIAPVLGITDPRRDKRIDFVGGVRGLGELEKRVDSGEMALALALYPTSMEDLMAVADANEVMPPKSTWFEPKLSDGLVSHVLD